MPKEYIEITQKCWDADDIDKYMGDKYSVSQVISETSFSEGKLILNTLKNYLKLI
jgi:hypothetical protein